MTQDEGQIWPTSQVIQRWAWKTWKIWQKAWRNSVRALKTRRERKLRSCLEQQHHLINMLKENCCRGLEQLNTELEKPRVEDAAKMKTQTQRSQRLEGHFRDLAKNHGKMIQFEDEHGKQHMQLWEDKHLQLENETLFSQTVREKEAEVLQLTAQARKLLQKLDSLQEKCAYESCRAPEDAQSQRASACAWEVNSLKNSCSAYRSTNKLTQVECAESQQRPQGSEMQDKLERTNEEKEPLLNTAMRGKALQDKQQKIQQLGKKLETAEKAWQRAGECLVKKATAVDNDLKVQELQQLESSKQAHRELSLQFDAYRKHSTDLLAKETLNVKLHHFIA
ncbi:LOW QUALITY PROTEIN: coiled-coil domain-containing protein 89 [Aegotheles albertisi]